MGETRTAFPNFSNAGETDGFVRKYEQGGLEEWTHQFGTSSYDFLYGISVDSTILYVGGSTKGTFTNQPNIGSHDAFLRKYEINGTGVTEVWTRQFGTTSSDEVFRIAATPTVVYVSGFVGGVLPGQTSAGDWDADVRGYDPDGNELRTHQFGSAQKRLWFGNCVRFE